MYLYPILSLRLGECGRRSMPIKALNHNAQEGIDALKFWDHVIIVRRIRDTCRRTKNIHSSTTTSRYKDIEHQFDRELRPPHISEGGTNSV
jgi:DNA-directed RNA polymerase specialized sigma24 family protein